MAQHAELDELIDIRQAASLTGRHPETIRRWVWSGRLGAQRRGRHLMVSRNELSGIARQDTAASSLREWAKRAATIRGSGRTQRSGRSAAGLIVESRARR